MDYNYDQDIYEVASRMDSSKFTRRPSSRPSASQTPKRHSARIEKPKSNHTSPRGAERRRTFTAAKQYVSLDDHYRKMFGLEDEETEYGQDQYTNTRPVSWHPSSSQWILDNSMIACSQSQAPTMSLLSSTAVDTQVDTVWSSYMHGQPVPHCSDQSYGSRSHISCTSQSESTYLPVYQQSQPLSVQHPTQQDEDWEGDARDDFQREQSTELIGLGLYDPPGTTLPFMPMGAKGLKLEETWQPPEEMEDADADEESEDEEEEPPRPEDAQRPQVSPPVVNMSGQGFFFDEEDVGLKNEWWYHTVKHPLPQAGTLGYGWI
ncbi:Chitin synthase export chaperone [Venturia nashicola]|uniref:Chitin synthase export chaperone n=1 Tax=Venturia nashicola TaxID=86259 RepID=A0A4Z1PD84_9PEZI|nr:Chitin synthase export chaperone [Venturia nashicola]TLD29777.1 Chitin synthase export chaperone [Venturia nashicola]